VETEPIQLGFLYHAKKQHHLYQHMLEQFSRYSKQYRLKTVLFSIDGINLDYHCIRGTILDGNTIREGLCDIPPLIYNFALFSRKENIRKMRTLRKMENITVINPVNRFDQGIIFEMLTALEGSHQFLLPSEALDPTILTEWLQANDTLYLLPEKTYVSPKAAVIKKTKKNNFIICIGNFEQVCESKDIQTYILKMVNNKNFRLMKGIPCMKKEKTPLEIRMYLQKGAEGTWTNPLMVVKKGIFSQQEMISTSLKNVQNMTNHQVESLTNLTLKIAEYFDFYIPFLGSCTLDFLLEEKGSPYLIYVAGFDQELSTFNQLENGEQSSLLDHAFFYLLYLRDQSVKEKGLTT
jgi:hypothetical protein